MISVVMVYLGGRGENDKERMRIMINIITIARKVSKGNMVSHECMMI